MRSDEVLTGLRFHPYPYVDQLLSVIDLVARLHAPSHIRYTVLRKDHRMRN